MNNRQATNMNNGQNTGAPPNVVHDFLADYARERTWFDGAAQTCAQRCETGLRQQSLRAIVSARAKRMDRLQEKLERRLPEKEYACVEDIYDDIPDLVGVRIALYFPGDFPAVRRWVESAFHVERVKDQFPGAHQAGYKRRFPGYAAVHYRARLKAEDGVPKEGATPDPRLADTRIEIQIASVLMHAWSEVEHDLAYKPSSGALSEDEYAILDELNGLVLAGEIALERLQRAIQVRVSRSDSRFASHYELAAFLEEALAPHFSADEQAPQMGRLDVLFRFLRIARRDRPDRLRPYLDAVGLAWDDGNDTSVADKLSEAIFLADPTAYEHHFQALEELSAGQPYSPFAGHNFPPPDKAARDYLLARYLAFENVARLYFDRAHPGSAWARLPASHSFGQLIRDGIFDLPEWGALIGAMLRRDAVVFATTTHEPDRIREAADTLASALCCWRRKAPEAVRTRIDAELAQIASEPPPQRLPSCTAH